MFGEKIIETKVVTSEIGWLSVTSPIPRFLTPDVTAR